MSTYLERRLALLAAALEALEDPAASAAALSQRPAIESEQRDLAAAPAYETSDRGFELSLLEWLRDFNPADGPAGLVRELNAEAALVALGRDPAIDEAAAGAIFALRDAGELTLQDMPELRLAAGSGTVLDELSGTALRRRLSLSENQRAYLMRDVAVMLPLRIETVFDPVAAGWRMRLRIVPDEASIRRDQAPPSGFEIEILRAMWQEVYDGLDDDERASPPGTWLDQDGARHAWGQLCATIPPHRAAWLADTYRPAVADGAIVIAAPAADAVPPLNHVSGFPPRVEIWAGFGQGPVRKIDAFDVKTGELKFDVIGGKPDGDLSVVGEEDRWWVSWDVAKAAGVGRELVLPDGFGPMDVRVLYVLGIGEDDPEEHFRAQIDSGEMAKLPLGVPTNAVDGEQAASLGADAEEWRDTAVRRLQSRQFGTVADPQLSMSIAGADADLPAMPVPSTVPALDHALVSALWPALWGHQIRDLWGCVDGSDRLAAWAVRYVRPEGPLPPIRIAEQPYGLLPTSAISKWETASEEGPLAEFEDRLKPHLLALRKHWDNTARAHGTAVGRNTSGLLDLISRAASSADYASRYFMPVELIASVLGAVGPYDPQRFDESVRNMFRPLYDLLRREPAEPPGIRQSLAIGEYAPLEIPLVVPTRWPPWFYENPDGTIRVDDQGNPVPTMTPEQGFAELLVILREFGHDRDQVMEHLRNVLPDSLLFRLLLQSGLLSCAAVRQVNTGPSEPILEPFVGNTQQPTELHELSRLYDPDASHDHPAGHVRRMVMQGLERLLKILRRDPPPASALTQIERAFRATLDTSMYRIDPWLTGFAARRLEYLSTRGETRFRLGAYGWVEGPMIGARGPTSSGLLHAPSHAQALTSVILRDAFISEALETPQPATGRNLWDMDLESRPIREAVELADEARLGSHIFEALGRRLERIAADRFAGVMAAPVDLLRRAFPLRAGRPDRGVVCHGVDGIGFFLDNTVPPQALGAADQAALLNLRAAMGPEELAEIELLRDSLDAYGDLLVAEGVHQVVQRRSDTAGAAMNAAAGLAAPPTLNFTQTPLSAEGLSTAVIVAVPFKASPGVLQNGASPARIADNSVPAALEAMFGGAGDWDWEAKIGPESKRGTLADIGLEPIEACLLSAGFIEDLFRYRLDATEGILLTGSGPLRHRRARAFIKSIGSQPLLLRDVVSTNEETLEMKITRSLDAEALDELRKRYSALRSAAEKTIGDLTGALTANDTAAVSKALFDTMRWGITATTTSSEQKAMFAAIFDQVDPEDAGLLRRLAESVMAVLKARLDAAPPEDTTEPIGRCIAELAAPEGQLAILSRFRVADLRNKTGLDIAVEDEALDEEWLPVTAAVRPHLARLEAIQLETLTGGPAGTPASWALHPWTNAREDHWLTKALADLEVQRMGPEGSDPRLRLPRFVAAYTCGGDVWQGAEVAVGIIDGWAEAIPRTRQTTTAAFGFNAPAARAPQAILLAVPPKLNAAGTKLENAALIDILEETRELAHARAVDAEELGEYLAVVPTAMLHATGPTGIDLET